MQIPKDLRSTINKVAFHAGTVHGKRMREKLLLEVERMVAAGETEDAIRAHLKTLEVKNEHIRD